MSGKSLKEISEVFGEIHWVQKKVKSLNRRQRKYNKAYLLKIDSIYKNPRYLEIDHELQTENCAYEKTLEFIKKGSKFVDYFRTRYMNETK